jgi:hypothetical protein
MRSLAAAALVLAAIGSGAQAAPLPWLGATTDEFALSANARELPLIHADPYLNNLLLKYCEAALTDRRGDVSQLRTRVENAISPLLPHGRVVVDDIARRLSFAKLECCLIFAPVNATMGQKHSLLQSA